MFVLMRGSQYAKPDGNLTSNKPSAALFESPAAITTAIATWQQKSWLGWGPQASWQGHPDCRLRVVEVETRPVLTRHGKTHIETPSIESLLQTCGP